MSSVFIIISEDRTKCTFIANLGGLVLFKEMISPSRRTVEGLDMATCHPYTAARLQINHGYQVHPRFHNLFAQIETSGAVKIVYIDGGNSKSYSIVDSGKALMTL